MAELSAYVIAAWGGARRVADEFYDHDRTIYLRKHIQQLQELRHGLDLVVVAVPRDNGQDGAFFDYVHQELPDKIVQPDGHETKVEVLWRDSNKGLAFGSFDDAFQKWKDEIVWWYWFEDDYVPMLHRFDFEMKKIWHQSQGISFLAARVNRHDTQGMPHAIISIGMTRTEKILAVEEYHGGLVYLRDEGDEYLPHEDFMSQRRFTHTFSDVGRLYDCVHRFSVGLRLKRGRTAYHGKGKKLLGPIQDLRPWSGRSCPTDMSYK